jgi:hypothetical protein
MMRSQKQSEFFRATGATPPWGDIEQAGFRMPKRAVFFSDLFALTNRLRPVRLALTLGKNNDCLPANERVTEVNQCSLGYK